MKASAIALFISIYFFCSNPKNAVQGMNPGQDSNIPPAFGQPHEAHLIAPSLLPNHEQLSNLEWIDQQSGQRNSQQDHFNNFPVYDIPVTIWGQGHEVLQQPYNDNLAASHISYNIPFSNVLGQDMQSGNLHNNDHFSNVFAPRIQQGQSSGSHPPTLASLPRFEDSPLLPLPNQPLTYFTRPELPKAILEGRHERLNEFEWQRKYHENELLSIYKRIADKWGSVPRTTMTEKLYPRMIEHLQKYPTQIDPILAGNVDVIKEAANKSGRRGISPFHPPSTNNIMTPERFIEWITKPSPAKQKSFDPIEGSLASMGPKQRTMIIKRLVGFWDSTSEVVEKLLNRMDKADLAPFRRGLLGKKRGGVEVAAKELRDWLKSKDLYDIYS